MTNLNEFINSIDKYKNNAIRSKLWEKLGSDAEYELKRGGDNAIGFAFKKLNSDQEKSFKSLELIVSSKRKLLKEIIISKDDASLLWLYNHDLLKSYFNMLKSLNVAHSFNIARHFWNSEKLAKLISEPLDILEIGGGACTMAIILNYRGLINSYTNIDLPEMLAFGGKTLSNFGLIPIFEDIKATKFRMLTPKTGFKLTGNQFDLFLNINSMSEMDSNQIKKYIKLVKNTERDSCIWFTINRIQTHINRLGKIERVNPLTWNWPNQNVIELEPEHMQKYIMESNSNKLPKIKYSTPIIRIAITGKGNKRIRNFNQNSWYQKNIECF